MRVVYTFIILVLLLTPRPAAAAPSAIVLECIDHSEKGQSARDRGQLLEARAELAGCAVPRCPAAIRASCSEWGGALVSRIPSLVIGVEDEAARPLAGASVALDGVPIEIAGALEVNPGTRTLRIVVEGRDPIEQAIVVREGERDRKVTVVVPARVVAAKAIASSLPPSPHSGGHGPPLASWIVGGLGLAAIATGAVFEVSGLVSRGDLDRCAPTCDQDRVDGIRARIRVGDIAIGAGLVAVAVGGALWFFHKPASTATARRFSTVFSF